MPTVRASERRPSEHGHVMSGPGLGTVVLGPDEVRATHARVSLRLSAAAWGLVLTCWLLAVALPAEQVSQSARTFAPVVAIIYTVLAVMAIRRAIRGRRSGRAVSRWASAVAIVDVVGLIAVLLLVLAVAFVTIAFASCTGTCITF